MNGIGFVVLRGYLLVSWLMFPIAYLVARTRLSSGKEDRLRYTERLGRPSLPRPAGKLIWFHAASLGESKTIMTLVARIVSEHADVNILITSGTLSSSTYLDDVMPDRVCHQFVPYDVIPVVRKFLDHWRPDVVAFVESELWPVLLSECRVRGIPSALFNARISRQSYRNWRVFGLIAGSLLDVFDRVHAQDAVIAERLLTLGLPDEKLEITGSLKQANPVLPCDEDALMKLERAMSGRWVWLAASTHEGEEQTVLHAHRLLLARDSDAMLILVPRHPERAGRIMELIEAEGFRASQRSRGGFPDGNHSVYLADTIGELGTWYRLAKVSFIGGSLARIGGHNPYEPGLIGSTIIHGMHVYNFNEIYEALQAGGASLLIHDHEELAAAVVKLMDTTTCERVAGKAYQICSIPNPAVDAAVNQLESMLILSRR